MENRSSYLAAIKQIIEYLAVTSQDFDQTQNLATERAVKRIFAQFTRGLGIKPYQLEWKQLHPSILSIFSQKTRLPFMTLESLSWLLLICDGPHEYVHDEKLGETNQMATVAVEEFAKLFHQLGLDIPEGIVQLVAQVRESGA